MKQFCLGIALFFMACQPVKPVEERDIKIPQSFADLLFLSDKTDAPLCTQPVAHIKATMSDEDWDLELTRVFEPDVISEITKDDFVTQIKITLRRAALKRRLNVEDDLTTLAQNFYDEIDDKSGQISELTDFQDGFDYYVARINEQDTFGWTKSPRYNLRFCVLNEYRATLHAANRAEIMARIEAGANLTNPDLLENITREGIYGDEFRAEMMARLNINMSPETMKLVKQTKSRFSAMLAPSDPKIAEMYWRARDVEIEAYLDYLRTFIFENPAAQLSDMVKIDQALRLMLGNSQLQEHFIDSEQLTAFNQGLSERITKVDHANTALLKDMLNDRGWFRDDKDGMGAGNNAWLIAQHADQSPEFQKEVLSLMEAELGAPGVSKSNYAYLYDRVQMGMSGWAKSDNHLQRYCTQGRCIGKGVWVPFPVEDPERIDEIRADMGMESMADYKSRIKQICVNE